jgi:hypothetical protein
MWAIHPLNVGLIFYDVTIPNGPRHAVLRRHTMLLGCFDTICHDLRKVLATSTLLL